MKAMIVTNNEAKPIAGALQKVLELVNVDAAICATTAMLSMSSWKPNRTPVSS